MRSIVQGYTNYLKEIFENSYDHIYLHDENGNILDANDVFIRKLGYSKKELYGMKITDLLLEEVPSIISDELKKEIKTGAVKVPKTYKVRKKNGTIIYIEVKTISLKKEGNYYATLGIGHDVSTYKEVEKQIVESAHKFRRIFESIPDLFFLVSRDGTILDYRGNIEDLKFPLETFVGKNIRERFPKHIIDLSVKSISKTLETHEPLTVDFHLQIKGSTRYFEARHLYFSEDQVLVFIRDITKRKKIIQKIKESEERFRAITEQSLISIFVIQDGKIKYFNEELPRSTGFSAEEIRNWGPDEFIKGIHPDDRVFVMEQARKKQEGNKEAISNYKYRALKKNGEVMWVELFSKTIIFDGKPADLVLAKDITEEKEAEQLTIEKNKKLLELQELRKDLIIRVSHELKTPMTSIYGAYQILNKFYLHEMGIEAQKYLEIGHRGSLRLKHLIDNLLDASRLESKKINLKFQKENLSELLVDCINDMKYLATNRQLNLKLDIPNEIYAEIDRLRFRQVLVNITSNAINNNPIEGEIFIYLVEKPDYIDVRIKDSGVGITEKEKEKLFEKFGKIERHGMDLGVDIEGSGLGLYISKEIVELHGGQIFVESEGRNKGATFIVRLFKKNKEEF
ncbi:MAG: PAS domain S-box protein [Candidatus Odinarchaeota archaeon]